MLFASFFEFNVQRIILAGLAGKHFQRGDQSQVFQIDGTQGARHAAQVFDGLLGEGFEFTQSTPRSLVFDRCLCQLHALFQSDDGLDRVVVQFARQAQTLFLLRGRDRADVVAQSLLRGLHLARHFSQFELKMLHFGNPAD